MMSTREPIKNIANQLKIKLISPDNYYSLQFLIEANHEIIVGRQDEQVAFYPIVDLSNIGAYGLGVSRTHATVQLIDDTLYVTDKSSNGTRLNGELLPKGKQCRVENHDMIAFGELNFHLVIQSMNTSLLAD